MIYELDVCMVGTLNCQTWPFLENCSMPKILFPILDDLEYPLLGDHAGKGTMFTLLPLYLTQEGLLCQK